MQITLESERLLFRPHLTADLDAFCAMEMDIDVRRYVGGYPRSREAAEQRFPKHQSQNVGTDRLALWATVLKAEDIYIGRCGLYPHFNRDGEAISGEAKLAFYIAPKYWGKGFATEAGRAFIHLGFTELALTRIVAAVMEGNDASLHILKKIGFEIESIEKGPRTFYHLILQKPMPG
jgi:ribosomal-protein-alanine N-acetyltransferase